MGVVFSVDPSSSAHGVAIWSDQQLVEYFTVPNCPLQVREVVNKYRPDHVYIEDQYLGVNFKGVVKLLESRVRFQTVLELEGVPVTLVHPKTWQAYHGLAKFKTTEIKTNTKRIASELTNTIVSNIEISDSIAIGLYAVKVLSETTDIQKGQPKPVKRRKATPRRKPTAN